MGLWRVPAELSGKQGINLNSFLWLYALCRIHRIFVQIPYRYLQETCKKALALTFRRRIKSRLPFAGIIRRLPYSTRFQDKG